MIKQYPDSKKVVSYMWDVTVSIIIKIIKQKSKLIERGGYQFLISLYYPILLKA